LTNKCSKGITNEYTCTYGVAKQKADDLKVPLIFVGYSLGALVGQYAIVKSKGKDSFSKQVLLAPATATRISSNIVKATFIFPEHWKLPSFTPEQYRANDNLPIKAYKMLFYYQDYVINNHFDKLNIPTLIFIDPKDELVSLKTLLEYIEDYELECYKIVELSSDMEGRQIEYHHLIVSDMTMGSENWELFMSQVLDFIEGKQ
jgi:hypothetical protein